MQLRITKNERGQTSQLYSYLSFFVFLAKFSLKCIDTNIHHLDAFIWILTCMENWSYVAKLHNIHSIQDSSQNWTTGIVFNSS